MDTFCNTKEQSHKSLKVCLNYVLLETQGKVRKQLLQTSSKIEGDFMFTNHKLGGT